MTIIVPEKMIFGRGVTPGASLGAGVNTLVPDVTYLAHPGLTLLPSGVIQITGSAGEGEWIFEGNLSLEAYSGTSRTSVLVGLFFNGIEVPSCRRYIYCRTQDMGTSAYFLARLTNLVVGDQLSMVGLILSGSSLVRVPLYGLSGVITKVPR